MMNWHRYLFSFDGRINRAKIWLFLLVILAAYAAFGVVFNVIFGASFFTILLIFATRPVALFARGAISLRSLTAFCVFYLFIFYIGLAVTAKRLHDRNKSAVWLLLFIVLPLILNVGSAAIVPRDYSQTPFSNPAMSIVRLISYAISIWGFVELYCLRGIIGENRYGPDPLAADPRTAG